MKTLEIIIKELGYIQNLYRNKDFIKEPAKVIYPKNFKQMLESYDVAVNEAPKKLVRIYIGLYIENKTQKQLASELDITEKYIQLLNRQLILFLQEKVT